MSKITEELRTRRQESADSNNSKYSLTLKSSPHERAVPPITRCYMLFKRFMSNILRKYRKDPKPRLSQRMPSRQRSSNYEILSRDQVSIPELTADDMIIVVMGPTGAGKSNFIHTLAGNETAVGHGLASYTNRASAYRLKYSDGIDIVLVDTPGFNDTHLSDLSVLEVTATWLEEVGKRDLQVSAFLYLHRISDNRMGSAPQKSLKIFQKTAGKQFFSRVTLITTMWPDPADTVEMQESEMRERELREEYWAEMIEEDSKVERFTNTRESARRIVDSIIIAESEKQWNRIQQELVDQGKTLSATDAGRELHAAYEDMVTRQNALMQQLRAEMEKAAADPVTITALREQLRDELVKWKNARKEMRKLESSGEKGWHHNLTTPFLFSSTPGNSPR